LWSNKKNFQSRQICNFSVSSENQKNLTAQNLLNLRYKFLCIRQRGVGLEAHVNGAKGPRGLRGVVRSAKFLGDAVRYEVAAEGFDRPLNVRAAPGAGQEPGQEVRLVIDPDQVLVFPPKDEKTN